MATRNIKLTVEYDGSRYSGWQMQERDTTIQGEITEAIFKVTGQRVSLTGAGRTDAGVHALGQTANFTIEHELETSRFVEAINFHLPEDIRILGAEEVSVE